MATKYSMEICDAETSEYTPVALFADFVPVDVELTYKVVG